ncbi:hypothetical protein LTR36_008113 [Oleoguttula mirabilis]|uniref:Uncharacterized protein n=1 Tax=Oleoguttula mirabilis TaxID=1507867 RepID=A0AAV9J8I0_9PEZI|nr:hypothetical protein LTR36_008113 [Oleoguttula mirabilis]
MAQNLRTSVTGRRTSSATSAVDHRKPKWAVDPYSYNIYMTNPRRSANHQGRGDPDYRMDNFAYDEAHLEQWQMPPGLEKRLPAELLANAVDWQKAGAALCTSLDRTHELYKVAMYYAYPDKSNNPFARRPSANEQAVAGASQSPASMTPQISMPTPILPATIASLEKLALTQSLQQQQEQASPVVKQVIGMETPPFSPIDSGACATPLSFDAKAQEKLALPDLVGIHSKLSPSQSPLQAFTPVTYAADFDANSWEFYLGKYDHEMVDAKECLHRLNGYGKKAEIVLLELKPELKPEIKLAVMDFTKWWETMRPKVRLCEERVKNLDVPKLEYVSFEWEMARARSMGQAHDGVMESS